MNKYLMSELTIKNYQSFWYVQNFEIHARTSFAL